LVFETAMMVQTNSMVELNEIEAWVVLVYPVFAPVLFVPVFQPKPILVVLSFHSLHLFLALVLSLALS
jgi:hypothetical protein